MKRTPERWTATYEAESKGVYQQLFKEDMNKDLSIPDDSYDATICVGTFTYAHVGSSAFDKLIRVTHPGGHISLRSVTVPIRNTVIANA